MPKKKSAKAKLEEIREILLVHEDPEDGMTRRAREEALLLIGDVIGVDMDRPGDKYCTDEAKRHYADRKALRNARISPAGPV